MFRLRRRKDAVDEAQDIVKVLEANPTGTRDGLRLDLLRTRIAAVQGQRCTSSFS
jgi:hypothetical protein